MYVIVMNGRLWANWLFVSFPILREAIQMETLNY